MQLFALALLCSSLAGAALSLRCHQRSLEQVPTGQYVPQDTPYGPGPDSCHDADPRAKCATVLVADKTWYRWHKEKEPELVLVPTTVKQTCCNSADSADWYCNPREPARHTQSIAGGGITVHCEATAKGFIRKKVVFTCTSDMCELPRHMWDQVSNVEHWHVCDDLIRQMKPQSTRHEQRSRYGAYDQDPYYNQRPRHGQRNRRHRRHQHGAHKRH